MRVLIGTPTLGEVTYQYASSLARLIDACARARPEIQFAPLYLSCASIHRSRNVFASAVLSNEFSHLLFIDSDMGFTPDVVLKLLDSKHDVCGCIYPKKELDQKIFYQESRKGRSFQDAYALSLKFVGEENTDFSAADTGRHHEQGSDFVESVGIGLGLAVITRLALGRMRENCPDVRFRQTPAFYQQFSGISEFFRFFDPITLPDQDTLDEDISFCHRWRHYCGGKIFALADQSIAHVGSMAFAGSAMSKVRAASDQKQQRPGTITQ